MTLAKFARMCEVLESQTPTLKAKTISESMSGFSDKETLIKIADRTTARNFLRIFEV